MSIFAKDLARGSVRALVIRVIATVIGLPLGCIYVFAPLWLLFSFDFKIWALAVAAMLWLGPMLIFGIVFPVGVVLWRKVKLDALFEPLGLRGQAYQTYFRQYHGQVEGRQVEVYFRRGPVLEIEVGTTLQTRLGITDQQSDAEFFANLIGQQSMAFDDYALGDLTVYAVDEVWARSLLEIPEVVKSLRRMTELESSVFTRQQVILRPGVFELVLSGNRRLFGLDVSAQQVRAWLDDLLQLAQTAESLPEPLVTVGLSSAEESIQRLRQRNPYLALWIGLGLILFFLVAAVVIFAAVFLLASLTGGL